MVDHIADEVVTAVELDPLRKSVNPHVNMDSVLMESSAIAMMVGTDAHAIIEPCSNDIFSQN